VWQEAAQQYEQRYQNQIQSKEYKVAKEIENRDPYQQ